MCRLVAVIASEVTEFGLVLKEAPRSLARLSREHPDGWGVAAHGGRESLAPPSFTAQGAEGSTAERGWRLHKGTERASECSRFQAIAAHSAGTMLVAHIRQKTVGPTSVENTHPFLRDGWVFAHNGTIKDQDFVRERVSAARRAEVQGQTDSELLFAHLLTRLDEAGFTEMRGAGTLEQRDGATRVIAEVTTALRERNVGAFNFLLSNGALCFVHRFGRTLFLLERRPRGPEEGGREESTRTLKSWVERRHAVLVASERLTDEPWVEVPEGALLRIDREPIPGVTWSS